MSPAAGPSQQTLNRLASLEESSEEEEEEEEGENTAKMGDRTTPAPNQAQMIEQRGIVTQRLSSIFDGWLPLSPTNTSPNLSSNKLLSSAEKRKSVSEPRLLEQASPIKLESSARYGSGGDDEDEGFEASFEEMLVSFTTLVPLVVADNI